MSDYVLLMGGLNPAERSQDVISFPFNVALFAA